MIEKGSFLVDVLFASEHNVPFLWERLKTEKTEFDSRVNFFLFYGGHCAGIASNTRSRLLAIF
jgi:hypothetical protein